MLNRIKFFRRRQFVLGPDYLDYEGWCRFKLFEDLVLTLHPDLPITSVENQINKAILLGYAIDPYNPEATDGAILQRFVIGEITVDKITAGLETLGGRFILIINCRQGRWLFHDACALRQVYYCRDQYGAVWCASQPETLAEHFELDYDQEMLNFRKLPAFYTGMEDFALIGERSPYKEIKYLLANHYLDLRQGTPRRYWPVPGCIGALSVDESIQLCKPIFQNSIKAAAERFDLKMGITAGCDSRKSLAASKAVKDKIYFFTQTPLPSHLVDMAVPARLLSRLGIQHHILAVQQMSSEFREVYELSATWARERHGHIAYSALEQFGPGSTVLNNNISEYSQVWYWLPKSKITGEGLAILKSLNDPAAIKDFQDWLDSAQAICEAAKMNILVLFQLELRSRWVANTFAEHDIAYESFNPYNNHRLFCLELSVNERIRRFQRIDVPVKHIKNMWPEVLSEPINPEKELIPKLKKFIWRSIVHRTVTPWLPLVEYLKYLKLKKEFKKQSKT